MEWILKYSGIIYWLAALFTFVFGLLVVFPGTDRNGWGAAHRIRKVSYLIALPLFCVSFGLGSELTDWYTGFSLPIVTAIIIVKSIISAIVIIEIFRDVLASGPTWTASTHLMFIVIFATVSSALLIFGILINRHYILS